MKTNDRRKAPLGQGGVGDSVGLVAFDADDTLWDCQGAFCAVEHALAKLLSPYAEADEVLRVLAATERRNMPLTGYGAKAFTLSMVEAAVGVSRGCVGGEEIDEVLRLGRRLMELPATPLPGVEATLRRVREVVSCPVVVFTKGELRDQEGKMDRSGLRRWFDDVVTVDDKTTRATASSASATPRRWTACSWWAIPFAPTSIPCCARAVGQPTSLTIRPGPTRPPRSTTMSVFGGSAALVTWWKGRGVLTPWV